ncbi:MAG: CCA tRNA nucleotidyltransferase [Candidatus Nanopelagicales bacterium]
MSSSAKSKLRQALAEFIRISPITVELGKIFAEAGYELALVGGPVRDAFLGRLGNDLDLTTNATPEQILNLVSGWADSTWDVGARFGTIGINKNGYKLELTTYRSESYDAASRKPEVNFGDSLEGDLGRRDFTINAMAIKLPSLEFVDLFDGLDDLANKVIRTPQTAELSFSDDPLRMLRAARFAAQLNFTVADDVISAMREMKSRLSIVSVERIRDEFNKLILGAKPRLGLILLVETGLLELFLPEIPALQLAEDEHNRHKNIYEHSITVLEQAIELEQTHEPKLEPDLILRLAALLHDIGKPKTRKFEDNRVTFHHHEVVGAKMTRKRMKELRYSNEEIDQVSLLVELHLRFHGFSGGEWTDSAVRRYVTDAADQLLRLHKLTRADSTTRNARKAQALQLSYNTLEQRIAELMAQEELNAIRPDLDGNEIMQILNLKPGPEVGAAYKHMLEVRLEQGPLTKDAAIAELNRWWQSQR